MGASVAGKQWANAVKTIGPLDQITIVLSLEPVQLEEILIVWDIDTVRYIKNVNYILCVSLEPEHGQCRKI